MPNTVHETPQKEDGKETESPPSTESNVAADFEIVPDSASDPLRFQTQWLQTATLSPDVLPFPRDDPPFNLTEIDWHQLTLTDADYTPHSWSNLTELISRHRLQFLLRTPSHLKAYLAWCMHVKKSYGGATNYLLKQRLGWQPVSETGALEFRVSGKQPLEDKQDFRVLRNDWPYGMEAGIVHFVVWSKVGLEVDERGGLTEKGRDRVEGFVKSWFRERVGEREGEEGSVVLWFKNTRDLQSVRSLEHFHVLLRGVEENVLSGLVH